MEIAIIGGTGFIGSKLVKEAASRGHSILAISRNIKQGAFPDRVTAVRVDVFDTDALAETFSGSEVVIHSFRIPKSFSIQERVEQQKRGTASIIAAVRKVGIKRLLAVGGAGTLEIAPGVRLMDSYIFPEDWQGGAQSTALIKELLQDVTEFEWTSFSPPYNIVPGKRTGKFRLGRDKMICDETGLSRISVDDYAVAMIDELETPNNTGHRFTAAY